MPLCVALLALFAAVSVNGDRTLLKRRSLLQDETNPSLYPNFPFCQCIKPAINPIDVQFTGERSIGGNNYACFAIILKNPNPERGPCRTMDVHKVEFDIKHPRWNADGFAGGFAPANAKAVSWANGNAGTQVLKMTQLGPLTQAQLALLGPAGYPLCWELPAGKTLADVGGLGYDGVRYAVFSSVDFIRGPPVDDCCPIGITGLRPPPPFTPA
eukprot:CAMPEP_0202865052 /NCGR_PEP_ID=MMETSP1391-20130828/5163_1 /ASSEMBLY_ACC=CAM_ASM_000867 /TAXON_ID=1034604 /ORGANISM="Chlamydomonas leiostraca, Strain SAG 11-49" /LENGTH=212 /DNA_ID=CAMNT_0049544845 /DNA_START=86 /DNA_END=721 /DNA_ORIENTATION=+